MRPPIYRFLFKIETAGSFVFNYLPFFKPFLDKNFYMKKSHFLVLKKNVFKFLELQSKI